jgi:hypothetical protein
MPIQTTILDQGNFVRSPEFPAKPAFSEYLDFADRLLPQWHAVQEDWNRSPFSAELGSRKRELDRVLADFVETFRDLYTIKGVEQDPAFLTVSRFFTQCRPIGEPFSILHCDHQTPLHTACALGDHRDLAKLNAALDEEMPWPWWTSGPHGQPCYLFGKRVWELRRSEVTLSEEGKTLLFLDLSEKHRQEERMRCGAWKTTANAPADFIPEKARGLVWRRAGGRCEKCGGHDGLDFYSLAAARLRGAPAPEDIQLLCTRCSPVRAT